MCFQLKKGKTWVVNALLLLHLNVPGCDPPALPGLWCLWDLTPVLQEEVESVAGFRHLIRHWLSSLEIHWMDRVVVMPLCRDLRSVVLCSHTPQQVIDMKILKLKEMSPRNWVPACTFVCLFVLLMKGDCITVMIRGVCGHWPLLVF